jgi:hypothetical protein
MAGIDGRGIMKIAFLQAVNMAHLEDSLLLILL